MTDACPRPPSRCGAAVHVHGRHHVERGGDILGSIRTRFAILILVVITAVAVVMGFAVSTFLTRAVSDVEARSVAGVVRRQLREADPDALFADSSSPEGRARWQAALSTIVRGIPGVVRCKVWNLDRVVVWSDDASLIGKQDRKSRDLGAALGGRVVARVSDPVRDDPDWVGRPLVLARIYVPVTSRTGERRGVVELSKIPSPLFGTLKTALLLVWAIAAAGGIALWLVIRPLTRPPMTPAPTPATPTADVATEIRERLGFFPVFFEPAVGSPTVLANLWQQTLAAYVDNPLPSLFKEKLFAYLSRYCATPYCVVCHSCALRPLGLSGAEILALLESPPRTDLDIRAAAAMLAAHPGPLAEWPRPGSPLDEALLACAIFMFVHPDRAERCQAEMRRLLGDRYGLLAEFLAYVKACHVWVEAHSTLAHEADPRVKDHLPALLAEEPRLAEVFATYRERVRREREIDASERFRELEERAAELADANDVLRGVD